MIGEFPVQMILRNAFARLVYDRNDNGSVELLTRPGCHLCDDAERELARTLGRHNVLIVNILDDKALEDEYVFRIPVVLHEGRVLAEGIIDAAEARRVKRELRQLSRSSDRAS